jgi:hypothetical protein
MPDISLENIVDVGVCVAIDGNDRKIKRHVVRLARRLRCWHSYPIDSCAPLTLCRSAVDSIYST